MWPKMKKFLLSWDCYGLEACVDITEDVERGNEFEKESLFERIKNPEEEPHNEYVSKLSRMVHVMSMRARFNPQRNYEIYMLNATAGVSKEDIEQWFEDSPQTAVDRVREIGTQLLSHRETQPEKRVIV
jgi:hypothetical protein